MIVLEQALNFEIIIFTNTVIQIQLCVLKTITRNLQVRWKW